MVFNLKGIRTDGEVLKRMGMRLRVQHGGGSCWAEVREIVEIKPKDSTAATAVTASPPQAPPPPASPSKVWAHC